MIDDATSFRVSRAIPWAALVGALLVLLAGIAIALYEEQLYDTQKLRETREQAEILAASVTAALSFHDRSAVDEYVEPMRVNPEIEAVGVYTNSGPLFAGFSRAGAPPLPVRADVAEHERDRLIVTVPVVQQATSLGTVYLRASVEPMQSRALRYAVLTLLVAMAAIVIAGLGGAQMRLQRQSQRLEDANARLQSEMTQRARAEDALRQSQKMEAIGQLSGAIAHDFNNLLMIVKGNLHLLQRKLAIADDDRHIAAAMEGIRRAAALTQRILAFSRKQDLSPTAVRINGLITGMDDLIRNSLRENIEIVKNLKSSGWTVLDRNQMENVILNLVINARDAMPRGGRLVLATEDVTIAADEAGELAAGDYVKLTVRDTGVGMAEEVRAKALDPFFTTKPIGQGTGLGLSTSFGFISQSRGHMEIDSAPGQGTTIVILLPRAPSREEDRERA
ncbi:MAG: ATP-binding protein [Rhizomicrobium sp.]|jgi:signal transduction histidine kinase